MAARLFPFARRSVRPGEQITVAGQSLNTLPSTFTFLGLLATLTITVYSANNFSASFVTPNLLPGVYDIYYGRTTTSPGLYAGQIEVVGDAADFLLAPSSQASAGAGQRPGPRGAAGVPTIIALSPPSVPVNGSLTFYGSNFVIGQNYATPIALYNGTPNDYSWNMESGNSTVGTIQLYYNNGPNPPSGIYQTRTYGVLNGPFVAVQSGNRQSTQPSVNGLTLYTDNSVYITGQNLLAQYITAVSVGGWFLTNVEYSGTALFGYLNSATPNMSNLAVQIIGTDFYGYPSSPITLPAAVPRPTPPVSVSVAVTPTPVNLGPGQTQQFSATVAGTSNSNVTWSINPVVGSITSTGLYTAPSSISTLSNISVIATSQANTSATGNARVNLQPANTTNALTITPATANLTSGQSQQFAALLNGNATTAVTWSTPLGSITSTGLYTAPANLATNVNTAITATSTTNSSVTATAPINLLLSNTTNGTLTITPATTTLTANQSQQFTASGATGTVTWSIAPSVGTITASGLYTAPITIVSNSTVTVTASTASNSSTATVSLQTATTSNTTKYLIWGAVGVVALLIVVALVYWFLIRKKDTTPPTDTATTTVVAEKP